MLFFTLQLDMFLLFFDRFPGRCIDRIKPLVIRGDISILDKHQNDFLYGRSDKDKIPNLADVAARRMKNKKCVLSADIMVERYDWEGQEKR